MAMLLVLAVVLLIIMVIYVKVKYFTLRGSLPGKSPQFLLGNMLQTGELTGVSPATVSLKMQAEYGDVYQYFLGPFRMVCLSNADDIEHVFSHRHIYEQGVMHTDQFGVFFPNALIATIGSTYKRHASVVLPLFRRGRVVSNLDIVYDCTDRLLNHWRSKPNNRTDIHLDMIKQCQDLLLSIFGFIGFDYDLQILNDDDTVGNEELTKALRDFLDTFTIGMYMPSTISKVYLKLSSRYRNALDTIHKYLNCMIEQEQSKTMESIIERKRTSLIASLVASLEGTKAEDSQKGLLRSEVLDEMLMFLVAGYETTSTALAWFIHLISKHPRVQAKIKAELGDNKHQRLSVEQLDSLVYLQCVLKEVFRFAMPAVATVRTVTIDDRLPASGAQLHKGDEVLINMYNLTRDKRIWSIDPDLFYPERFQGEDKDHHSYALIPFGGGHRQCIGQDLARLELTTIAARLMQYVTFGDGGPDVNAGGHLQKLTLMPKNLGVTITFD